MEKKKWVVLRLETKSREFQSRMLLTHRLVNNGYGVVITRDYGLKTRLFPRGIYMLNNIFKTNNQLLKKIKKNHNEIIILDEEGLVYINKEKYLQRVPEENLKLVSKFLCFGKEQFDIISERYPKLIEKIVITGNPRINLLNKKFEALDSEKVQVIKKDHGDYFLIVSNFTKVSLFGTGINKESRYKRALEKNIELKLLHNDNDIKKYKRSFEYVHSIYDSFLSMLEVLSTKFPDKKIIVRPHPSESRELWDLFAKKYSNIEIIYEGNLTEWIKGSLLVIQNSCTSAIESLYLNKPCISFRPYLDKEFDQPLPNKLSVNVKSIDEVIDIASKAINKTKKNLFAENYSMFKHMATDNISFSEGDESIIEIIKEIDKIDVKETYFNKNLFSIAALHPKYLIPHNYKHFKVGMGRVVHKSLYFLGLKNNRIYAFLDEKVKNINYAKSYQKNKFQTISVNEIKNTMNLFNDIYSTDRQFNVQQLDEESFIIE